MNSEAARIRRVFSAAERITVSALMKHRKLSKSDAKNILEEEYRRAIEARPRHRSLNAIYRALLDSLRNRGMMANVIGELPVLSQALCNFDPQEVLGKYGNDKERLLQALVKAKPGLSRKKLGPRSLWRIFADGSLGGAKFLTTRFKTAKQFHKYVDKWSVDPDLACAFPLFLSDAGIKGLGPALAADFLKETGMNFMAKPDTYTRRFLALAGLISSKKASDSEVLRAFYRASQVLGPKKYPPAVLDKILWHLGSGKFSAYGFRNPLPGHKTRVREFQRCCGTLLDTPARSSH